MKETLPPIPQLTGEVFNDITAEVNEMWRTGTLGPGIAAQTERLKSEALAQLLPPSELAEIEKEEARLSKRQAELQGRRQSQVQAVTTYRNLIEEMNRAAAKLQRADDQMAAEMSDAEAQRQHIVTHIGVVYNQFDRPGALGPMFDAFNRIAIIEKEWPIIRQRLVGEVERCHKAALDHAKKHGIGKPKNN